MQYKKDTVVLKVELTIPELLELVDLLASHMPSAEKLHPMSFIVLQKIAREVLRDAPPNLVKRFRERMAVVIEIINDPNSSFEIFTQMAAETAAARYNERHSK